jgi:hypothetical protein
VTTLAPLPGRGAGPDDNNENGGRTPEPDDAPVVEQAVDLTRPKARPAPTDVAGQATWLFGLALALLTEGTSEEVAMAEVLAEAGGRSRALEGAYGRAVALLSEFPGDPMVHRTVDLMAKALLRSRRPARAAEEA